MNITDGVILRQDIRNKLNDIGEADIVIGIPSYNNARTIGHVVKAVQAGILKYFPDGKAVIVNSDGGSKDGTMEVVQNTGIEDVHSIMLSHRVSQLYKIAMPYHGIPGKGSAFRSIFEIASSLNAKACAVVDSDLRSITPEWIELLIKPVLKEDYDYVAPLYQRHKYDGTITNGIVYPITRALYGKRIRQPIGGDFGFSGRLAEFYLTKNVWETDVARYGIDIWMTTTAIANRFKVCQAFLGAKIHDQKDPGADLSDMLYQVVGSIFGLMNSYEEVWRSVKETEPVPVFGFRYAVGVEPVQVDINRMVERFRLGVNELGTIWEKVLSAEAGMFLTDLADAGRDEFFIPDEIWAEIVYSFAVASHAGTVNNEHLLKSLTPLYIGKTASFVLHTMNSDAADVEEKIERLCAVFEEKKTYLLENWQP